MTQQATPKRQLTGTKIGVVVSDKRDQTVTVAVENPPLPSETV